MKKTILFGAVLFFLASCKKDYTCSCSWNADGITQDYTFEIRVKEKDAATACTYNVRGAASAACYLK